MSAEILRRAASLMRERAESATRGPWGNDSRLGVYVEQIDGDHSTVAVDSDGYEADGEHIASWHPAVALAVADWLDYEFGHPFGPTAEAIDVARAYLGESA